MFAGLIDGRSHHGVTRAVGSVCPMIHGACVTPCSRPERVRGGPPQWLCGPFAETAVRSAADSAGRKRVASFFGVDGTVGIAADAVTSGAVRLTTRATVIADASYALRRSSVRTSTCGGQRQRTFTFQACP
jgi:hypothetical protein